MAFEMALIKDARRTSKKYMRRQRFTVAPSAQDDNGMEKGYMCRSETTIVLRRPIAARHQLSAIFVLDNF
jgi:hypothetical protein